MEKKSIWRGSVKSYVTVFILSLLLTLAAYFLATEKILSGWMLSGTIALLGLIQAWIQLLIFLNVGREPKPDWNLIVFLFAVMVTLILVFLSLWIMNYLNYNLM